MTEQGPSSGRRRMRFLSPSQKYEIWIGLLRGESTISEAADRAGVDRSTVMKLRMVAKQGAPEALAASRPGVKAGGVDPAARRGKGGDREAVRSAEGDGRQVDAGRGKRALGLSGPVSRRVDAATKAGLLKLIDEATAAGWEHRRACRYPELAEGRAWRWWERREAGRLEDRPAGGNAVHGLLADERDVIIALFDAWGEVDRSHRKLAHCGSYEQLVWVSPATVRRVLAANGLVLRRPRRAGRSERRPFPEWATYTKQSIWIYDVTHFAGCPRVAVITIMDLVTRKLDLRSRLRRGDQHPGPGRVLRRLGA